MSEQAAGKWRIGSDLGLHRAHLHPSGPKLGVLAGTQSRPKYTYVEVLRARTKRPAPARQGESDI
jgi:hypothetical protein